MQPGALFSRRAMFAAAVVLVASCQRDVFIGADITGVTGGAGGTGGAAGTGGSTGGLVPDATVPCTPVECEGATLACGNCDDDDGDGLADMDDPDCLGPCHPTEDNFVNPHQDGNPCVQDCYFDRNSGFDEGCIWSLECDPESARANVSGPDCAYDPTVNLPARASCETAMVAQSAQCGNRCLPLVPNGCDCFGCCEVRGAKVWLGSVNDAGEACDLEHVLDPTRCRPCTQVESCLNRCTECERCIGKAQLPASCTPAGECPTPECDRGAACGAPCLPPCPSGQACVTGCCVDPPR